jgi:hypothetical protein
MWQISQDERRSVEEAFGAVSHKVTGASNVARDARAGFVTLRWHRDLLSQFVTI